MLMTKKEMKQLKTIKKHTITLFSNGMLPRALAKRINALSSNVDRNTLNVYMELTEHYVKQRGYYKKYPSEETRANIEINLRLKEEGVK